jgi:hypothetical protein
VPWAKRTLWRHTSIGSRPAGDWLRQAGQAMPAREPWVVAVIRDPRVAAQRTAAFPWSRDSVVPVFFFPQPQGLNGVRPSTELGGTARVLRPSGVQSTHLRASGIWCTPRSSCCALPELCTHRHSLSLLHIAAPLMDPRRDYRAAAGQAFGSRSRYRCLQPERRTISPRSLSIVLRPAL